MTAIGVLLIALILVQPALGVRRWRQFLARCHEPGARVRHYRRVIVFAWSWTALIALGMWLDRWPASAVGLVAPRWSALPTVATAAMGVALLVGLALPLFFRRAVVGVLGTLRELLPRTPTERVWFVAVALTAGFCEELLHRGFLLTFVALHWPAMPTWAWFVVGSVPFGAGHAYQGRRNIVLTGLFGAAATGLYLVYRSLWVPIVVHALVDLRAALLMPSATEAPPSSSEPASRPAGA